jgi:hypothetical protein
MKTVTTSLKNSSIQDTDIHKMGAEVLTNGGLIPDSWKPWAAIIIAALQAYESTATGFIKIVIEMIIAAFEATEK